MKRLNPVVICASVLLLALVAWGCDSVRQLEFGIPAGKNKKWGELNPATEMQDQP